MLTTLDHIRTMSGSTFAGRAQDHHVWVPEGAQGPHLAAHLGGLLGKPRILFLGAPKEPTPKGQIAHPRESIWGSMAHFGHFWVSLWSLLLGPKSGQGQGDKAVRKFRERASKIDDLHFPLPLASAQSFSWSWGVLPRLPFPLPEFGGST